MGNPSPFEENPPQYFEHYGDRGKCCYGRAYLPNDTEKKQKTKKTPHTHTKLTRALITFNPLCQAKQHTHGTESYLAKIRISKLLHDKHPEKNVTF